MLLRGWALVERGEKEKWFSQNHLSLVAWWSLPGRGWQPYFSALMAEVYADMGKAEEGLTVLTEALAVVKGGERWWEAELYRLKGELTLQSKVPGPTSKVGEAEECFLKAIEIARRQQAKSLELRATVSLARLWQPHGKRHEARNALSEIYGWFTEGFDTKDLQEAKALLEELN
jgi:predicted ATPase